MNLTPLGFILTALSAAAACTADNGSNSQALAFAATPLLAWATWAAYRVNKRRRPNGRKTRKV